MNSTVQHRGSIRKNIVFPIFLALVSTLAGCAQTSTFKPGLSDPGGVYSSDFKELELKTEVSGRLSEGNGGVPGQEHVDVVIGEAAYSGVPT